MDFNSLCDAIIDHIEQDCPEKIDKDTLLLEKELIDSFAILGIIIMLEEKLNIEIQPEDLSSDPFASVAATANWALGQMGNDQSA